MMNDRSGTTRGKLLWIAPLLLTAVMTLAACGGRTLRQSYAIRQNAKFDHVELMVSIEDFIAAGFQFGDSCDVSYSNGLTLEDVPFFSGFYVRRGAPVIVGYPGYEEIIMTRNNQGLWTDAGLRDGDTVTVTLREAGKYKYVQETLAQTYSDDRADFRDDEQFSNFRALRGGRLKDGFLYRGVSPVDNAHNRAACTDALLKAHGIRFILDLADSEEELRAYRETAGASSDHTAKLYDDGQMVPLNMSSSYESEEYKQKLAVGLRRMTAEEGPVYIHCQEGKDRTGFVCLLLEALAGADYYEMCDDYMKTYDNYYGITKETDPEKYDAIVSLYFNGFASYLHGTEDPAALSTADYSQDAVRYLLDAGMTADEIDALRAMITKE